MINLPQLRSQLMSLNPTALSQIEEGNPVEEGQLRQAIAESISRNAQAQRISDLRHQLFALDPNAVIRIKEGSPTEDTDLESAIIEIIKQKSQSSIISGLRHQLLGLDPCALDRITEGSPTEETELRAAIFFAEVPFNKDSVTDIKNTKFDPGDGKSKNEKRVILLSEVPLAKEHFPGADLNHPIDAPLKKVDGTPYNGDQNALIQVCNNILSPQMLEILLEHGANPNATTSSPAAQNVTALMIAARTMPARSVDALLKHGADYRAKDSNGHTVIDWAACWAQPWVTKETYSGTQRFDVELLNHSNPIKDINDRYRQNSILLLATIYEDVVGRDDFAPISKYLAEASQGVKSRFMSIGREAWLQNIVANNVGEQAAHALEELELMDAVYEEAKQNVSATPSTDATPILTQYGLSSGAMPSTGTMPSTGATHPEQNKDSNKSSGPGSQ